MNISVSIIDDDSEARGRMAAIIDNAPGCHCLSQHPISESAIREIPCLYPNVALIAFHRPDGNGVECVRRLKQFLPSMQVIMLTSCLDIGPILHALSEGATGCLLKPTPPWELIHAIREAHHGGSPLNSQIARKIVEFLQRPTPCAREIAPLSPRQTQVLALLAQGCSYDEIARMTQLTYATVHTHIRHLYKKLQVKSRSQAVAKHSGQNHRLAAIESMDGLADIPRPPEWPVLIEAATP